MTNKSLFLFIYLLIHASLLTAQKKLVASAEQANYNIDINHNSNQHFVPTGNLSIKNKGDHSVFSIEPESTSAHVIVQVRRTIPESGWKGSSFEGLENEPFSILLKRINEITIEGLRDSLILPLPSPVDFKPFVLADALVKIDSLRGSFVIASKIEILSKSAEVMFGGVEIQGNSGNKMPNFFCSFRPKSFKFGDLFNSLRGTMLDQLDLNGGLWSIAGANTNIDLLQLP